MKRICLLILFVMVAVSCSGMTYISDPPPADGPQLITEELLRRQLDLHTIQTLDEPIAQLLYNEHVVVVNSGLVETWDQRPVGFITYRPRYWNGTPFTAHILFGAPDYAPDGGTVTESDCQTQPGGVQTTGEFTDIDNDTDQEIEHEIEKAVTETSSSTVSLSESLELVTGQTFEAGESFGGAEAKETLSFEEHFGLASESVTSSSTETAVTVRDKIIIPGHREFDLSFTTDNNAVNCHVRISATGDWGDLRIMPPEGRPYHNSTWCDSGPYVGRGSNGDILARSDAVDKSDCTIRVNEADALIRLIIGNDVRCIRCADVRLNATGERAVDWFGRPESRHVSFDGRRKSAAEKDASYRAIDTTGYSRDCVNDILDDAGRPMTDTLLDECKPNPQKGLS